MADYTYIAVHQDENVAYDDLVQLNADLMNAGVGELLEDISSIQVSQNATNWRDNYIDYDGRQIDFIIQDNGATKFASIDDGHAFCGHVTEHCLVWSCFHLDELQIIANHMTAGKLVIRFESDGWADEYYVITPGHVKEGNISF